MIYLVSGGSRGIGANLVERAVKAGHDVAFTFHVDEASAREVAAKAAAAREGAQVRYYRLDVRDRSQVDSVVDQVVDDFDTLDVLVANAGVSRDGLLMSMSDEEWDEVIATNLTGTFYLCRAVIPALLANHFGRIIGISSLVAGGATGQANYAASKAGMHGLIRSIAKEYGRKRITANVVAPGFFDTDMTRQGMPEQIREFWRQQAPVESGRVGKLDELSATVIFLASREASFINGQVINVTAGLDWSP